MVAPTIVLPSTNVRRPTLQLHALLDSGCIALVSDKLELPDEVAVHIRKLHGIDGAELKSPRCLIITFNEMKEWTDFRGPVLRVMRTVLQRDILLTGGAMFPMKMTRHPFTVIAFDMSSVTLVSFGYHLGAARYDRETLNAIVRAIVDLPQVKRCSWSSPEIPVETPRSPWKALVEWVRGWLYRQPDISQGRRRPPVTFTIHFNSVHSWIDPFVQGSVRRTIAKVVGQSVVFDGYL